MKSARNEADNPVHTLLMATARGGNICLTYVGGFDTVNPWYAQCW